MDVVSQPARLCTECLGICPGGRDPTCNRQRENRYRRPCGCHYRLIHNLPSYVFCISCRECTSLRCEAPLSSSMYNVNSVICGCHETARVTRFDYRNNDRNFLEDNQRNQRNQRNNRRYNNRRYNLR